jgi:hypothetical protein
MSSTLTTYSNNINTTYPYPGVDNDTQGFRDNFANIKNALNTAAGEIGNLLQGTVKTTDNLNDFNRNVIYKPTLQAEGYIVNNEGSVSNSVTVDALLGSYQQLQVNGSANLSFSNWAGVAKYSKIRLEIKNANTNSNSTVTFNGSTGTTSYTLSSSTYTRPVFFDVWSPDNGATIYAHRVIDTSIQITTASVDYANFVVDPAQPNITSLGQLSSLSIGGANLNVTGTNLIINGVSGLVFQNTVTINTPLQLSSLSIGGANLNVNGDNLIIDGISGLTIQSDVTITATVIGSYFADPGTNKHSFQITSNNPIPIGSTFKFNQSESLVHVVKETTSTGVNKTITTDFFNESLYTVPADIPGSIITFSKGKLSNSVYYAEQEPATPVGLPGDTKGAIFVTSSSVYMCYKDYVNTSTYIWTKITSSWW